MQGYTSGDNGQHVAVKDMINMCANSDSHQNRGEAAPGTTSFIGEP